MAKDKNLRRRIAELEGELRAARKTIDKLIAKHDGAETVRAVLDGITPLFVGYQQPDTTPHDTITPMGSQGLDERAGISEGLWFPENEFDPSMESPDSWPTTGMISTPTTAKPVSVNGYRIGNGRTSREDGQPMFQAGTTGPPPESATE